VFEDRRVEGWICGNWDLGGLKVVLTCFVIKVVIIWQ